MHSTWRTETYCAEGKGNLKVNFKLEALFLAILIFRDPWLWWLQMLSVRQQIIGLRSGWSFYLHLKGSHYPFLTEIAISCFSPEAPFSYGSSHFFYRNFEFPRNRLSGFCIPKLLKCCYSELSNYWTYSLQKLHSGWPIFFPKRFSLTFLLLSLQVFQMANFLLMRKHTPHYR